MGIPSYSRKTRGQGIVAVLIIVIALSTMGMAITMLVATGAVSKTNDLVREQATALSNAGLEYALMRIGQGVDPNGNIRTLGSGTFTISYNSATGLISSTGKVNAMMGAASVGSSISGPLGYTMASCLTVNTGSASLTGSNKVLSGVTLQNTCGTAIIVSTMTDSWSPAISEKLTQIVISGSTVYNNPSGITSGQVADITDTTIAANSTVPLSSITFNSVMAGKNFTVLFTMSDGSSKSAFVQLTSNSQAACLFVDTSAANAGGTGYVYLQGITLYNGCSSPATIQINKMTVSWVPTSPAKQMRQISIGGTTVYTSGGVSSGTQVTLSTAAQIASGSANGKAQSIQFSGDMRGYNYTIVYTMNDSTTQTVAVNLYEQTPNTCLKVVNTGCVIGGTGSVEIQGEQWQNTCALRVIVSALRPVWTSNAKVKEIDVNGILSWSGGGSNSNSNLAFSTYVEIPGGTTYTVNRYLFNKSMAGQYISSMTFTFFPFNTTYAYSANTCP